MNKKLKTLAEHETAKAQGRGHPLYGEPYPNGIACPKCGQELWDSHPNLTLTSNPPRKNIHCSRCGYTSTRTA